MSGSTDRIVFYGTLMEGRDGIVAAGVVGALRLIGPAFFFGRLFDLGAYPGVRLGGAARVRGELYDGATQAVLEKLDAYEECDPHDTDGALYVRRTVACRDGVGASLGPAWVYEYNGDTTDAISIPGGDWLAYRAARG